MNYVYVVPHPVLQKYPSSLCVGAVVFDNFDLLNKLCVTGSIWFYSSWREVANIQRELLERNFEFFNHEFQSILRLLPSSPTTGYVMVLSRVHLLHFL
jgi:hypothetical protein